MPNAKSRGFFCRPHAGPRYGGSFSRRVARTRWRYRRKMDRWAANAEAASMSFSSRISSQTSRLSSSSMPAGTEVYWRVWKELMAGVEARVTKMVGVTTAMVGLTAVTTAVSMPPGLDTPPGISPTASVAADTPRPPNRPPRTCLPTAVGWPGLASTFLSSRRPIRGENSDKRCDPCPPPSSIHPSGTMRSRHRVLIRHQQEDTAGRGRGHGGRSKALLPASNDPISGRQSLWRRRSSTSGAHSTHFWRGSAFAIAAGSQRSQ